MTVNAIMHSSKEGEITVKKNGVQIYVADTKLFGGVKKNDREDKGIARRR